MNARAHHLADTLLDTLGGLPGANAISVHARKAWTIILITASSDEAVIALAKELKLGETEVRSSANRWWRGASSDGRRGALRMAVAGPHHLGPPPSGDAGDASS